MSHLYFLLHVLGQGVAQRSELDVYFDDVLMMQGQDLGVEKFFRGHLTVEKAIEVRVDDDFLLPVLHGLLLFIKVHLILINSTHPLPTLIYHISTKKSVSSHILLIL
jgi:hypothetical protein